MFLVIATTVVAQDGLAVPPPSRYMTFIDEDNGYALVLQTEPAALDAGSFVFRVPGRGLYQGRAGTAMSVHSATSVTLNFDGPAVLGPQIGFDTVSGPLPAPLRVTVHLQAQVDPAHRGAEATLSDGSLRFHLQTRNDHDLGALRTALTSFERALVGQDWSALYWLTNLDVRSSYTASAFASQLASQVAQFGPTIAIRRGSIGPEQRRDDGAVFVAVSYSIDVRAPSGAIETTPYDAFFIPERGVWKFWYTAAR